MVDLQKEKPVVLVVYLLYSEFPEDNSDMVIFKMVVTNPETMPCDLILTLTSRIEILFNTKNYEYILYVKTIEGNSF